MPINFSQQKIFIHIPKNAGTSITKSWEGFILEGHHTIDFYKNSLKHQFKKFETFCILRDPVDRFISNYNYARAKKSFWHSLDNSTKHGIHPDYNKLKDKSLEQTAELLWSDPNSFGLHWYPQVYWITCNNEISIDSIYMYENVESEILKNYNIKIQTLNKIPRENSEISTKTLEIIKKFYKKDYDLIHKLKEEAK